MSEMALYIFFRRLYPSQDMVRSLNSDLLAAGISVERAGGAWVPARRTRKLQVWLAGQSDARKFEAALVRWVSSRRSPVSFKVACAGKAEEFNSLMPAWQVQRLLHRVLPFAEAEMDSNRRILKADGTPSRSGDVSADADRADVLSTVHSYPAANSQTIAVTIYLANQAVSEQVEAAVDRLLSTSGLFVIHREEPVLGSWFRRIIVTWRRPSVREAALVAAHVADTRLVLAQDAAVTATLLQNLGPVITSLQPTKDAVLRIQALLIVKVEWTVQVYQLTAAQQAVLDHQPQLLRSPGDIIQALSLMIASESSESTLRLHEKQPEPG